MNKTLRFLLVLLAFAGIAVGVYLTLIKVWYLSDPSYASLCNVNETFNCDRVNSSQYSEIWGTPLGIYGIAFYTVILALSVMSFSSGEKMQRAVDLVFGLSVAAVLASLALAFISGFMVGAWCLGCIAVYTINALLLVVSYRAAGGGFRAVIGRLDAELSRFYRSPLVYTAGLVFFGIVLIGGSAYRQEVAEAKQRTEDKLREQLARGQRQANTTSESGAGESSKPAEGQASASSSPSTSDHPPHPGHDQEDQELLGPPQDLKLLGHEPIRGRPDAPVKILAWKDFECPHCSIAAAALDEVVQKAPETVAVYYKQYPLDMSCNPYITRPMHENACNASIASMCAGRQGLFWELHDQLFRNQTQLSDDNIRNLARGVGVEMASFESCLKDRSVLLELNRDIEQGKAAGVNGTPAIYINGRRWNAQPSPDLLVKAARELAAQGTPTKKDAVQGAPANKGAAQGAPAKMDPQGAASKKDAAAQASPH